VQVEHRLDVPVDREQPLDARPARRAHLVPPRRIGDERYHMGRERVGLAGGEEQAGDALVDDLGRATGARKPSAAPEKP